MGRAVVPIIVFSLTSQTDLLANFKEITRGVFVEDFEEGSLDDWEYSLDAAIEVVEEPRNKALFIKRAGESVATLVKHEAVALELDMRGAGTIRIGGRYEVSLTSYFGCTLEVRDKGSARPVLLMNARQALSLSKNIRIKLVAAGSILRVFLNGRMEFESLEASAGKAAVTLAAGEKGTLFDNVKLSTVLAPEDGATARPAPGEPLIFSTKTEAILKLQAANQTLSDIQLTVVVRHFSGEPVDNKNALDMARGTVVEFGVAKYFRINTEPEKTIKTAEAALAPGFTGLKQINLGELPEGFFMLDISLTAAGKEASLRRWPVSVQKEFETVEFRKPIIPIGVYTRLTKFITKTEPAWWKTYMHAIAYDLMRHHINTVIASGEYEPPTIEIFNSYGIAVLVRDDRQLGHPGVLGTLLGDEPKPDEIAELKEKYASLHEKTDKPVLTCMVGDSIGIGTGGPLEYWKELQPRIRLFRWYGIKKSFYGILNHAVYKGGLPFSSILRIVQASSETPYWVVLPAFGSTEHEAYFQNPSAAQVKGMMHLSLAHGAKGILLFSYQGFDKFVGLVDPINLRPGDEKLAAVGEVAARIAKHAGVIQSLKRGGLDIRCPNPAVEAIPLTAEDGHSYVYVVNKNTRETVETELMLWAADWNLTKARDLYAENILKIENTPEGFQVVSLRLMPGEGSLILTDARPK
ncbi:MAG: hypothetical protein O3B01_23105 [Planctomycetota bacterium]|nr:hypothetical protein [Planctomycetota bacterium]MDA1141460.1 hypothetical protein [Planctomycetota bacterium]